MTVNANPLNIRINSDSVGNLTELELLQLADATSTLENSRVYSVASINNLPVAADNTGRFIFVQSIQDYRYSDGLSWIRDFNSRVEYTDPSVVWAWGLNSQGRLGDNTTVSKRSPVSVVGGFTDWRQVSAGNNHTAAVRANGTLWSWGFNGSGILGDNTTVSKISPVSVLGGFTDWCQVSAGSSHTAAVRINGSLWTWGGNNCGQLGDNTILNKSSPISVVGGFTDWCQVSAGADHIAAVRTNGTLWSWGCNAQGQLGDNTSLNKSSPVSVVGGFTNWCQVSAGQQHTAAIQTNSTLWSWGINTSGELGDNTYVTKSSPVSVLGGFTNWCQVSAGCRITAAIRTNGTIWTWGCNNAGQLGDNTIVDKSSPVSVVGGFLDWCQVSAGYGRIAAVRTNGSLWSWGCNAQGQLGDDTIVTKSSPVSVVGGFNDWCQVSVHSHTTAIRRTIRGFNTQ